MAHAFGAEPRRYLNTSRARLGDYALFLCWTAQGTMSAIRAGRLGLKHDVVGATHVGTVAAVLFISAILFILRGPAAGRGAGLFPKLVAFVGTWSIIVVTALPMTWRPQWLLTLTTVGLVGAYAWVIWSLLTLRRSLSIFPEARQLVRHGPYALVRHPLYSAHIVCYVLIALPRLSIWTILVVATGIAGELLRARFEERLLGSAFGDYAAYVARTPRFVPRLIGGGVRSDSPSVAVMATSDAG
jgi:protein-S-isoprenylcysteine O-methyltransferase Ste14